MTSTNDTTGPDAGERDDHIPTTPGAWMRAAAYRRYLLTREYAAGLGDTAREGISDEDYATTMATLEKMARNLGWTEGQGRPEWNPGGPWGWRGHGHGGHGCSRGSAWHGGYGRSKKARDKARDTAAKKAAKKADSA